MASRSFPKPWTAEATPGGYLVKDGNDLPLSYVYVRDRAGINAPELTVDEARQISELIARLPELVELLEQVTTPASDQRGNTGRSLRRRDDAGGWLRHLPSSSDHSTIVAQAASAHACLGGREPSQLQPMRRQEYGAEGANLGQIGHPDFW